jgi:uncharacterized oxidoreductase
MSRFDPLGDGSVASVTLPLDAVAALGMALLRSAGAPPGHAATVIEHLVEAERMGLASHGVMRVPQYLSEIRAGIIDPAGEPMIERAAPGRLAVDGRRAFGQVVGVRMVDTLKDVAREAGIALATGRHLGHTGRVGAYPERLARAGIVAVAVCNGAPSGHWVSAFGGRDGRISTNPIAIAWPVEGAEPVVADFSTAATAEGVVRTHRDRGTRVPEGTLLDADGRPTDDPATLYREPRGTIAPLGGALGYRGTALALLVEVLTTLLNGDRVGDRDRAGTDMTIVAIAPQPGFDALAADLSAHIRGSVPIDPRRPVLMPGDVERARVEAATGDVSLPLATWEAYRSAAREADLDVPGPDAPTP